MYGRNQDNITKELSPNLKKIFLMHLKKESRSGDVDNGQDYTCWGRGWRGNL